MRTKVKERHITTPALAGSILAAWLAAAAVEYLLLPGQLRSLESLDGLREMSVFRILVMTAIISILLIFMKSPRLRRWTTAVGFAVLSCTALLHAFSWPFLAGCVLILGILFVYSLCGWNSSNPVRKEAKPANKASIWLTVAFCLLFFFIVSVWTVCRVRSFSAPSYDFGIFSQMFYSMKTTGLPMTTLERDGVLSHFRVHISPIYYLMLPFYCLVLRPETLQVLQAAVITSSVIPLWKIGKHHGLSGTQRMLLCILLLLLPGFSGGVGYDLHENCFLTPLLLWVFYAIDRKNGFLTAIFALLTLLVKEDAPVYIAVVGLWLTVKTLLKYRKDSFRDLLTGLLLLGVSVLYFLLVTDFLAEQGDGVMTYRYANFMYDGSDSLLTVVKAVFLSPVKALYECVDPEKLYYLGMTLLPLLGLPVLTRRYERYILLIPYILINLMSDYQYQHHLFFQYGFGSTACLIYLTAVNLSDLKESCLRATALLAAAAVSAVCFCSVILPKAVQYPAQCIQYEERYDAIREALDTIPQNAAVTASTFYTTELSDRTYLYDIRYAKRENLLSSQYIVLAVDGDYERYDAGEAGSGFANLTEILWLNDYSATFELPGILVIYQKTA